MPDRNGPIGGILFSFKKNVYGCRIIQPAEVPDSDGRISRVPCTPNAISVFVQLLAEHVVSRVRFIGFECPVESVGIACHSARLPAAGGNIVLCFPGKATLPV